LRLEGDPIHEYDFEIVDVAVFIGSTPDDQQVGFFAHGDAAGAGLDAKERGSAQCRHLNGLQWAESNPDGLLDAVVVGKAGHPSGSESTGIGAQNEAATGVCERERPLSC
jgi:hypothetical protein